MLTIDQTKLAAERYNTNKKTKDELQSKFFSFIFHFMVSFVYRVPTYLYSYECTFLDKTRIFQFFFKNFFDKNRSAFLGKNVSDLITTFWPLQTIDTALPKLSFFPFIFKCFSKCIFYSEVGQFKISGNFQQFVILLRVVTISLILCFFSAIISPKTSLVYEVFIRDVVNIFFSLNMIFRPKSFSSST